MLRKRSDHQGASYFTVGREEEWMNGQLLKVLVSQSKSSFKSFTAISKADDRTLETSTSTKTRHPWLDRVNSSNPEI